MASRKKWIEAMKKLNLPYENIQYSPDIVAKNRKNHWATDSSFFISNSYGGESRRNFIATLINANNVSSILELGCSSGINLLYISNKNPHLKLTGLDVCKEALTHGKKIEKNPADLIYGDIYNLSNFKTNEYDVVFTCTVLIHIPSEKVLQIIKEMARIAKYFIINIEDNGDANEVYWTRRDIVGKEIPHRWITNYKQIYKNLGLNFNIINMENILKHEIHVGMHLMWSELLDKNLIIPK